MSKIKSPDYEDTPQAPDFSNEQQPMILFAKWMAEAEKSEPNDPNAMGLATVDESGMPNLRTVLLKGTDDKGFVFYTNTSSAKGCELKAHGKAALNFHWKSLRRQVRLRGFVEPVSDEDADAYYQSRARGSRIGAWASKQSQELESRFALEKQVARYTAKYGIGTVPRPDWWSGYRLTPLEIEFWHDRPFRLHDRLLFQRDQLDAEWQKTRLYP